MGVVRDCEVGGGGVKPSFSDEDDVGVVGVKCMSEFGASVEGVDGLGIEVEDGEKGGRGDKKLRRIK